MTMRVDNHQYIGAWQRQRLRSIALTAIVLLLLWQAAALDLTPLMSANSWSTLGHFIAGFWPLTTDDEFLRLTIRASAETLAIATLGMTGALFIGAPMALMVSRALSLSQVGPIRHCWICMAIRLPFRLLALLLRSLPELVWILLFVRVSGLGPMAAILAITFSYGGMLAKVYDDIMESGALVSSRALMLAGAGRLASFFFGILPAVYQELLSYSVYRWECALRASVILGFVGAGGLGQQLELSLRMFNGHEVATLLLAFFLLVLLADGISVLLRWLLK